MISVRTSWRLSPAEKTLPLCIMAYFSGTKERLGGLRAGGSGFFIGRYRQRSLRLIPGLVVPHGGEFEDTSRLGPGVGRGFGWGLSHDRRRGIFRFSSV